MNTSARINFAAVAGLVVVAFCFSACPDKNLSANSNQKFFLKIGKRDENVWVDVKSQTDFNNALIKLKNNGGEHHISYLCKDGGTAKDNYDPEHSEMCDKTNLDRSPAGDPNATQFVRTSSPQDLDDLLKTFKEP